MFLKSQIEDHLKSVRHLLTSLHSAKLEMFGSNIVEATARRLSRSWCWKNDSTFQGPGRFRSCARLGENLIRKRRGSYLGRVLLEARNNTQETETICSVALIFAEHSKR